MNDNNNLDGTWEKGSFRLVIKKNKYVSFYNGFRYGKGNIIYDNGDFTLTSTHAKSLLIFWTPFVEIVKGKYSIDDKAIFISKIEGRYFNYNGRWVFTKK